MGRENNEKYFPKGKFIYVRVAELIFTQALASSLSSDEELHSPLLNCVHTVRVAPDHRCLLSLSFLPYPDATHLSVIRAFRADWARNLTATDWKMGFLSRTTASGSGQSGPWAQFSYLGIVSPSLLLWVCLPEWREGQGQGDLVCKSSVALSAR